MLDEPKSDGSSQLFLSVELFLELVLFEMHLDGLQVLEDIGRPEPQLDVDWLNGAQLEVVWRFVLVFLDLVIESGFLGLAAPNELDKQLEHLLC